MKKLLSTILLILLFVGCGNNIDSLDCKECATVNYDVETIKIGQQTFNSKNYSDLNLSASEFHSINAPMADIQKIVRDISSFNFNNLRGVILYSDSPEKLSEINSENVSAFVVYENKTSGNYNVRIFIKNKNLFYEYEKSNLETKFLSTNDFVDISKLINGRLFKKTFAVINFKNLIKNKYEKSELQEFLNNKISADSKIYGGAGSFCNLPCSKSRNAFCTASENQYGGENWWCMPDVRICAQERAAAIIAQQDSNKYQFEELETDLYNFRDYYLNTNPNGEKYIDLYYSLSANIIYEKFKFHIANETFKIIKIITPHLNTVTEDPNSSEKIILNTHDAFIIKAYLNTVLSLYDDDTSKNNIYFLIMKIDEFTGKSNQYITSHL